MDRSPWVKAIPSARASERIASFRRSFVISVDFNHPGQMSHLSEDGLELVRAAGDRDDALSEHGNGRAQRQGNGRRALPLPNRQGLRVFRFGRNELAGPRTST